MSVPLDNHMKITFITFLLCGTLASTVRAGKYDLDTNDKYVWTVIVDLPETTPDDIRKKCLGDLRVSLESLYPRELVKLEIVSRSQANEAQKKLITTLTQPEPHQAITGEKTHFIQMKVDKNDWQITLRTHDGDTGHTTTRTNTTRDTSLLGRLAAMLAVEEFGPTATIRPHGTDRKQVFARFRGGKRPGFEAFVQVGDVFAVYELTEKPSPSGRHRAATYLRAIGPLVDGEIRCEIVSSVEQPLREHKEIVAHRCIKLPTRQVNKVQIRLANKDQSIPVPASAVDVWASERYFFHQPGMRDRFTLEADTFRSGQPMKGLICVTVRLQQNHDALFVVPITDEKPIMLTLDAKSEEFAAAGFERDCERLRTEVYAALSKQVLSFDTVGVLVKTDQIEKAHAESVKVLGIDAKSLADFNTRYKSLSGHKSATEQYAARLLHDARNYLNSLQSKHDEMKISSDKLKKGLDEKNDPKRLAMEFDARNLNRDIRDQVERGDIPRALELYDKLLKIADQEDVRRNRKALADEWEPKSVEHTAARKVLLEQWNTAKTADDYAGLAGRIGDCVTTLIKNKDHHGLRNLLYNLPTALDRLTELRGKLDGSVEADRILLDKFKQLVDELVAKSTEAQKALKDWDK